MTTSEPSQATLFETTAGESILSAEALPASQRRSQGNVKANQTSGGYGQMPLELSESCGPNGSFSKTLLASLALSLKDSLGLSASFKERAISSLQSLWVLMISERRTDESEYGSSESWQTPDVEQITGGRSARGCSAPDKVSLKKQVECWTSPRSGKTTSEEPEVWQKRKDAGKVATPPLGMQVKQNWPTMTVTSIDNKKGLSPTSGDGLQTAVKKQWPTPTAVTETGGAAMCKWGGAGARAQLAKTIMPKEINGSLNPAWVAQLMMFPDGWLDLSPDPEKIKKTGKPRASRKAFPKEARS